MLSIKDLSLHDTQPETSKACTGKVLLMDDRISDLPDEILLRIISFLTLKEAGSTSVLSKRWRHVWAYVPHLNFDASEILDEMQRSRISRYLKLTAEEAKYFRWVDQVVSSHRAHTIDEFRVRFNFQRDQHNRYKNFDNWLRFAMEKRVKILEFNTLAIPGGFRHGDLNFYTFPSLHPWSTLTSLDLANVDVTGEILQKFLSDCPNLERLTVTGTFELKELKFVGPLKLKYLKLWHCYHLKHLGIYAPNLTELSVEGFFGTHLFCNFSNLSRFMSQLEVFSLYNIGVLKRRRLEVYPIAPRLKMLHIGMDVNSVEELFNLRYTIKSCPVLHKLELQLFIYSDMKMTDKGREAEVFPHEKLKILEISEFTSCEAHTEFAKYLIKTFGSVEKITINIQAVMDPELPGKLRAKEEAERLFALVKPQTNLEIICPPDTPELLVILR